VSNRTHTIAAGAYSLSAAATDQRLLESHVLMKAARKLEDLARRLEAKENVSLEEIGDTLDFNQKLWQVFLDDMRKPEHPLPQEIKNNVASLAVFVFKQTVDLLLDTKPEKFNALININRNIAAGLAKKAAPPKAAESADDAGEAGKGRKDGKKIRARVATDSRA
jgi:flagellar biosynthesis activator protein FlaF